MRTQSLRTAMSKNHEISEQHDNGCHDLHYDTNSLARPKHFGMATASAAVLVSSFFFVLLTLVDYGRCVPLVKREIEVTSSSTPVSSIDGTLPSKGVQDLDDARAYLKKYGHSISKVSLLRENRVDETEEAIKRYQAFFNLSVTGKLNTETLNLMNSPRCGRPDWTPAGSGRRKRYYVYSSWLKNHLTYTIRNYPSKNVGFPTTKDIDKAINDSFVIWNVYSKLQVEKSSNSYKYDIEVGFYSGDHGDEYSFDGPGKTLAHAFFPEVGKIHLDDDEVWSNNSGGSCSQYDIRMVLSHEIGHALGLDHTNDSNALMYPYYRTGEPFLGYDDIKGIQDLYGENPSAPNISDVIFKKPSNNCKWPVGSSKAASIDSRFSLMISISVVFKLIVRCKI